MSLFFIFSSSFLFFTRLTYLSISIYSMNGIDGLRRMQMMTKFCNSGFPCPPPPIVFSYTLGRGGRGGYVDAK